MALIKYGPTIASASGSVGGTTFARNRAGAYIRQRSKPVVPVSARRTQINGWLGDLVAYWQTTLGASDRAKWDAAAKTTSFPNKLGDAYTPTGLNLYIRTNASLYCCAQAKLATPPINPVGPPLGPTLTYDTGDGVRIATIGSWDPTLTGWLLIHVSAPCRPSINYHKGPYVRMKNIALSDLAALPAVILGKSLCTAGARLFFRLVPVLTDGAVASPTYSFIDLPTPL